MWRVDIGDIGVVSLLAGQERYSGGAADGCGAVVALVEGALVEKVLLDQGDIVEGVHVQILVIGQDEDNIWLLAPLGCRCAVQPVISQRLLAAMAGQSHRGQLQTCCKCSS